MRRAFVNGIATRIVVIAVSLLYILSCSKDSSTIVIPGESDDNQLLRLDIKKSENIGLTADCWAYINGSDVYITVPMDSKITDLKPTISVSPKASIYINGKEISLYSQGIDFTNIVNLLIKSESGRENRYRVMLKRGIAHLDSYVYEFMFKYSIPGVAVAISSNERSLYESGFGFASLEGLERARPDHLFRLASVSKQFTTIIVMKLIEQNRLKLTDRVFGEGAILESEFNNISAYASQVTIKNLLEHNTGWVSNPDPMFTSSFSGQSLDQRIRYVLDSPQSVPGTKYSYFNMGFGILGRVIEKVTAKSYETNLKEVMSLAGIDDVHVGKDRAGKRANEVVYYSQDGRNGYANEMSVIAAAGGVIASVHDMTKLLFCIDGKNGVPDIISAQTRERMLTPSDNYDRYALGWRVNHPFYPNSAYHSGNLAGTSAMWVMGPKFNCVVLCNSRAYLDGYDDEYYGLLKNLIEASESTTW